MDINTIDDLLKYLSEYTQLIIGDYTVEKERSIVYEAERLNLIYKSRENTFHLDRLGKQVVDSRLTWAAYQAEKEAEKYSFDEAIRFGVQEEINKATRRKTGRNYYGQSVDINNQQDRTAGEPHVLPLAPDVVIKKFYQRPLFYILTVILFICIILANGYFNFNFKSILSFLNEPWAFAIITGAVAGIISTVTINIFSKKK